MNRRSLALLMVCTGALTAMGIAHFSRTSAADDQSTSESDTAKDGWMMVKLNSAQRLLEDLTSGDFDRMEVDARRMHVLNQLEQWLRDEKFEQKSEYQGQLHAFEFASKELIRHASDRDMDGALKSYVSLTESCVRCHQLIRDLPDE